MRVASITIYSALRDLACTLQVPKRDGELIDDTGHLSIRVCMALRLD